jgi:hypothetical protein
VKGCLALLFFLAALAVATAWGVVYAIAWLIVRVRISFEP